jgi:hypothetical protein
MALSGDKAIALNCDVDKAHGQGTWQLVPENEGM